MSFLTKQEFRSNLKEDDSAPPRAKNGIDNKNTADSLLYSNSILGAEINGRHPRAKLLRRIGNEFIKEADRLEGQEPDLLAEYPQVRRNGKKSIDVGHNEPHTFFEEYTSPALQVFAQQVERMFDQRNGQDLVLLLSNTKNWELNRPFFCVPVKDKDERIVQWQPA